MPTDADRLDALKTFGRFVEGVQLIILGTFGQYLASGGAQQLSGAQWRTAREWFGGYQNVGWSLIGITIIGLLGLLSLGFTKSEIPYTILMWIYTISAATWFIGIGITHGLARVGSTGLWTLGLAGLFFLSTRIGITVAAPKKPKETK